VAKRLRVGVIFGGKSGEHEVSLNSAKSIMAALDTQKYELVPIAITKAGRWLLGPNSLQLMDNPPENAIAAARQMLQGPSAETAETDATAGTVPSSPETKTRTATWTETQGRQTSTLVSSPSSCDGSLVPPPAVHAMDVVIPVLHGSYGEDGTIQGLLEMLDVPYVGAGVLASAVGMDKIFMKRCFAAANLPQVQYTSYLRKTWEDAPDAVMDDVVDKLGFPCFVKPANLGSSVGISKAKDRDGLRQAIQLACAYDRKIIVEQGVDAREVEVAVLGNDHPMASVPGEVTPCNEFYDYRAKYLDGDSVLTIPAPLSAEQTQEIRDMAVRAFQAVDASGLGRVDFFVERATGRVILNEINTMPGFTEFSMYPKLWEATGVPYGELIERLIALALERHEEKQKTITDFTPRG